MKKILLISWIIVFFGACTSEFEEINTNPNIPINVTPDLLLSQVIYVGANEIALASWNRGNIVAQHTAKINFTDFDRYLWGSESGLWNAYYGNLRDIKNLEVISTELGNKSYQAMALIMKSWTFSVLTDNWGDIPYSEAISGKSDGIFQPKYDTQEAIYNGILADLAAANELLKAGQGIQGGDLLFGGDIEKWRKFTNSLRIRYLVRISNKKDVSAELQSIIANEPIFESNEDNAIMEYYGSQPSTWPVHTYRVGSFDEYRLSHTIEEQFTNLNDDRLFKWFRPTDATIGSADPVFSGMPNGLSENNATTYNGGALNVSRCGQILYEEPNAVDAIVMTYGELQFLLAEAAQQGWVSGDAKTFYENGVNASFEYWSVDQDTDAYLAQAGVAYDGQLETIMTQKWINSFLTGYEGWYDLRRTGLPTFIKAGPDNVNGDVIPVRFLYPDNQQTLNGDSYQEAISRQGADDINTKMWAIK
ncbi:MAG: SusD/RagB family nutrient-binding outer membrane lipoprotein [Flammeovirgaceae bacterium]|nr:SusD/RagB family nutrient-binding outer membrane lipoprotein [Flammeovirgaceae bacterium]